MKTREQAEKKAKELYPVDVDLFINRFAQAENTIRVAQQEAFLEGYSQLAKDLVEWLDGEEYAPTYGEIYSKLKTLNK